jgi:hypothetical protein
MTPPRYITTPPTPNSLPDPLNAYIQKTMLAVCVEYP